MGMLAPTKIILDIPDFADLNVPIIPPQDNTGMGNVFFPLLTLYVHNW